MMMIVMLLINSFEHDNKYQKEFDNELKNGEQNFATNETQDEHFKIQSRSTTH